MKTSELKKWLDENFIKYHEDETYFELINSWAVQKNKKWLVFSNEISNELAEKIVEYYNTPLNEREDEKKYELQSTCSYRYDWGEERLILFLLKEGNDYVYRNGKTQYFTKQEIDNFPKEIKGAIGCGFLRKVEVE